MGRIYSPSSFFSFALRAMRLRARQPVKYMGLLRESCTVQHAKAVPLVPSGTARMGCLGTAVLSTEHGALGVGGVGKPGIRGPPPLPSLPSFTRPP